MRERPVRPVPGGLALPGLAGPPGVLADPGAGEDRQVPRGGRQVDLETVHRAQRPPGDHHRPGRAIGYQGPGDPPEQLLHRPGPQPAPPCGDRLMRGDLPPPGPRQPGQQPGQGPDHLRVVSIRQQGHRDHDPHDERQRHQPPPLARRHQPGGGRLIAQFLDHPVAQHGFQHPQPHLIRQPPVCLHRS